MIVSFHRRRLYRDRETYCSLIGVQQELNDRHDVNVLQFAPRSTKKWENSMLRSLSVCLFAIAGSVLFATDDLIAQTDLATIVKERQDLMKTMGRSFKPIVAVVKDESTDLATAAEAAQTMNASIVKAATMFPEGTAKGEVPESRAKPAVWAESAEFEAAAKTLTEETAKLVVVANSGNVEDFKAQFQVVSKACVGCHEGKGSAGGKFRFPREE